MDYSKDIKIVGYDGHADLITDDYEVALAFYTAQKKKYSALNWGIRTIEEALKEAYNSGARDEFENANE